MAVVILQQAIAIFLTTWSKISDSEFRLGPGEHLRTVAIDGEFADRFEPGQLSADAEITLCVWDDRGTRELVRWQSRSVPGPGQKTRRAAARRPGHSLADAAAVTVTTTLTARARLGRPSDRRSGRPCLCHKGVVEQRSRWGRVTASLKATRKSISRGHGVWRPRPHAGPGRLRPGPAAVPACQAEPGETWGPGSARLRAP